MSVVILTMARCSSLGDNPTDRSKLCLHPHLLDVRVLLLELVGKAEGDDGQALDVVLCVGLIVLFPTSGLLLGTMNVGKHLVEAHSLECA